MQIVVGVKKTSPKSEAGRSASNRPAHAHHQDDSFRAEFYLIGHFQTGLDSPRTSNSSNAREGDGMYCAAQVVFGIEVISFGLGCIVPNCKSGHTPCA
jgi:hypothetical protein